MPPRTRAVTDPASSMTVSSSVATLSCALVSPAPNVTLDGVEPARVDPVAVT